MEIIQSGGIDYYVVARVNASSDTFGWTCYCHNQMMYERFNHINFISLRKFFDKCGVHDELVIISPKAYMAEFPCFIMVKEMTDIDKHNRIYKADFNGVTLHSILSR